MCTHVHVSLTMSNLSWNSSPWFDTSPNTINSPWELGSISFSLDTQQSHSYEIKDSAFTPQGAPWQQFIRTINQPSRLLLGQGYHEEQPWWTYTSFSGHSHRHYTCTFSGRSSAQHTTSNAAHMLTHRHGHMYLSLKQNCAAENTSSYLLRKPRGPAWEAGQWLGERRTLETRRK